MFSINYNISVSSFISAFLAFFLNFSKTLEDCDNFFFKYIHDFLHQIFSFLGFFQQMGLRLAKYKKKMPEDYILKVQFAKKNKKKERLKSEVLMKQKNRISTRESEKIRV